MFSASFLKNNDSALNITDFFWSSHEHCWRWDFTCSRKNTVKTSKLTPVKFFSRLQEVFWHFFTFVCSSKKSSDMESKENTDLGRITYLEFFRITHLKLLWNFRFLVSSGSILKKPLVLAFSWSLPVCCLPVMFSAESEMFRNVHHWISYDQRCQN